MTNLVTLAASFARPPLDKTPIPSPPRPPPPQEKESLLSPPPLPTHMYTALKVKQYKRKEKKNKVWYLYISLRGAIFNARVKRPWWLRALQKGCLTAHTEKQARTADSAREQTPFSTGTRHGDVAPDWRPCRRTPIIAFRQLQLPPKLEEGCRKPLLGVCLTNLFCRCKERKENRERLRPKS